MVLADEACKGTTDVLPIGRRSTLESPGQRRCHGINRRVHRWKIGGGSDGTREEFDVCVIGTGAGGGVMIKELTEAGFSVVALERGPFLNPSHFVDDELNPRRFRHPWREVRGCYTTASANAHTAARFDKLTPRLPERMALRSRPFVQ